MEGGSDVRSYVVLFVAGLAACGGKAGEEVPGALSITPESLDFGTVGIDVTEVLSVTVENSGGAAANVLSVTLTDGDAAVWRVDRNGVAEVLPGEALDMLVTFAPRETRNYSASLQIRTDDADSPNWTIALRGLGGPSTADADGDGYSVADGDCNDADPEVFPGAEERCNGIDDDCDGVVPADEADADGDGFRICAGDCDDAEPLVNPGEVEVCDDQLDNDCDGTVDLIDLDGDGHSACGLAPDCDDDDINAYPVVVSAVGIKGATGTEADPFSTIDEAFAALDGVCNTIYLDAGEYPMALTWSSGSLNLIGMSGRATEVTLTANKGARHLTVDGGTVRVEGLTFTGGAPLNDGGAVRVINGALVVDDVTFVGNSTGNDGGAVAVVTGSLTLDRRVRFEGNTAADDGGAVYLDAATFVDTFGTVYLNNTGNNGGAVFAAGGAITLQGAEVRGNVAAGQGGGVAVTGAPSVLRIERNRLLLNDATASGGGIGLRDLSAPGGFVRNNRLQDNESGNHGGGIGLVGATTAVTVANNTLTGNVSAAGGAGVGASVTGDASAVTIAANVMHSNDGPSALFVSAGAGALVAYNTGFATNSGVHFDGEIGDGAGGALDPTNVVRNPTFVAFTDNGDPDDDDLSLAAGSPEIDDGPPQPAFNDTDGSTNDRGYTGGPAAP